MAIPTHKERIGQAVSAVASSGLGAFTLSTAESGYKALGASDDGKYFDVLAIEGTSWEVRRDCVYTHAGTSLSRGTLVDSSTGSAITFTTAVKIYNVPTAFLGQSLENSVLAVTPGGRLTLTSGTPVTTSDVTGATTIYFTPYIHNMIPLYDGTRWQVVKFAEVSIALGTLTSGIGYDIFGYLSGGALALELVAWSSATVRATSLSTQDGRYVKSGDATRLYLGSFATTSTTTTEDSATSRLLYNMYNRVWRPLQKTISTVSWTYNAQAWRAVANDTNNRVRFMNGLSTDLIDVSAFLSTLGFYPYVGIGLDTTTGNHAQHIAPTQISSALGNCAARYAGYPGIGLHYLQQVEWHDAASGSYTAYGTAAKLISGLSGGCFA